MSAAASLVQLQQTFPTQGLKCLRLFLPFPCTTRIQSSHSFAISINTLLMTMAEAINPCPSPSKTLTSHLRIILPSHLTFSIGTRVSLLPWWMSTDLVISTYRKPIGCFRSRQTRRSTAGLAPVVEASQIAPVSRLSYVDCRSFSDRLVGLTEDGLGLGSSTAVAIRGRGSWWIMGFRVLGFFTGSPSVGALTGARGVRVPVAMLFCFERRGDLGRLVVMLALVVRR